MAPKQIGTLWLQLLLGVLGREAPETASIAGLRLVNKSSHRPMVKLELWLRDEAVPPSHVRRWMENEAKAARCGLVSKYTPYRDKVEYNAA